MSEQYFEGCKYRLVFDGADDQVYTEYKSPELLADDADAIEYAKNLINDGEAYSVDVERKTARGWKCVWSFDSKTETADWCTVGR